MDSFKLARMGVGRISVATSPQTLWCLAKVVARQLIGDIEELEELMPSDPKRWKDMVANLVWMADFIYDLAGDAVSERPIAEVEATEEILMVSVALSRFHTWRQDGYERVLRMRGRDAVWTCADLFTVDYYAKHQSALGQLMEKLSAKAAQQT